ncbi:MAG: tRNA (N(6)-L-threonylcarbamoyladenosine(37)-C(2))-methylthiotransferase MtaB [Bacteroidetes bacterium]|nr:MAG: tRNA (N(6)-L-threonylcarbamoyladenosine(37)-C(2))-methylthiotransferase MtaB [Bacteroidota bacterium]
MKKVAFYTLGCKLNFSETSTISRSFEERGYKKVDFTDKPDIFIINTCSVTDNADKKCRKIVREARQISADAYVAIIGCYAQLKPVELSEIEGVDAVLGAAEKFRLLDLLGDFKRSPEPQVLAQDIEHVNSFNSSHSINDRTRTFLKVQDGCDYSCTFCTIPLARGNSRSDTIENVVNEARQLGTSGVKEIVLTGVNTGDFGLRNGKREDTFFDLVQALDEVEEVERFRISSIEPNLLTHEIIDFVATSKRFMPHFHIPLQSGSDILLKSMKRRYLSELYLNRVEHIRKVIPMAGIGVDVIVGFPGETEDEFLKTYNFLNEMPVSYLHVFTYSERTNTSAAIMVGAVPKDIRNKRSKMLRSLSEKKKRCFYEQNVGLNANILFENDVENDKMHGFTENYVRVSAKYDPLRVNEIIPVSIAGINADGYAEVEEIIENIHA